MRDRGRMSLLARQNNRSRVRPAFIRSLERALGRQVDIPDFLGFEVTDELTEFVRMSYDVGKRGVEPSFVGSFSRTEEAGLFAWLGCFAGEIRPQQMALLFRQSKDCGALSIGAEEFFAHSRALLGVDGDGLTAVSESRGDCLVLDFSPEDETHCFELVICGPVWPVQFLLCRDKR